MGWSLKSRQSEDVHHDWQYVAVLPFEDLSPDKSLAQLGERFARDIIDALSRNPELRVIAYESSLRAGVGGGSQQAIGGRLGADLLVSGSTEPAGNQLRVNIRLTDTGNGGQIWSHQLDLPTTSTIDSGHLLRQAVMAAFREEGDSIEVASESTPRELDNQSYERYLQARRLVREGLKDSLRDALGLLEMVHQADPGFASARTLALDAKSRLLLRFEESWPEGQITDISSYLAYRQELGSEARGLAQRYPLLAEAHLLLGRMQRLSRQFPEARQSLENALELNPSLGEAHRELGWLNRALYGSWAITVDHFRQAVSLDPYSLGLRMALVRGLSNISARRDEMQTILHETKERMPWNPDISFSESVALVSEGRYAESIRVLEDALARGDDPRILRRLADDWYALDQPLRSRQLIPDFEAWRGQSTDLAADPVNRCPDDLLSVNAEIRLWSAYVCADRRRPAATRQLLEIRFEGPDHMASDPDSMLGSEYSCALLMSWALKESGDERKAEAYAQVEERAVNSRSENGKLESARYYWFMARLAALRGDSSGMFEHLDSMLELGQLDPRPLAHPVFDPYRDSPGFESILQRRKVLVDAQLAQFGLPPPDSFAAADFLRFSEEN